MEYKLHDVLMLAGGKAVRKANDVLGFFKEESVASGKPHHSYYEPETPSSPTSNLPSYFSDLTSKLPKKANSVKVQNLRHDQVIHTHSTHLFLNTKLKRHNMYNEYKIQVIQT